MSTGRGDGLMVMDRAHARLVPGAALALAGLCAALWAVQPPASAAVPPSPTAVYDVSVYAGGTSAYPATNVMSAVESIAFDVAGNLYAADYNNFRIVRISPSRTFTVIAGNGSLGAPVPGPATSTPLGYVTGVAVEADGDVLATDPTNNLVYRITPGGQLSIVAGGGVSSPSTTPAAATSVALNAPNNVVVDPQGGFYVVESDATGRVDKVDAGGQLTVVAGGGATPPSTTPTTATSVSLSFPSSAVLAPDGTLYVVDAGTYVEKITTGGLLSVVAGNGTTAAPVPGPATASPMAPQIVTLDSAGNLIVSDNGNGFLEKVTPAGTLSVIGGDGTVFPPTPVVPGPALNTQLITVSGLALNPLDSEVYVSSRVNSEIYRTTVRDVPAAPTGLGATRGNGGAALTYTAPNANGSPISGYEVTTDAGATWSPLPSTTSAGTVSATLTGLSDSSTYTILVRATNAVGTGAASASLVSAPPPAPPAPPAPPSPTPTPTTTASATPTSSPTTSASPTEPPAQPPAPTPTASPPPRPAPIPGPLPKIDRARLAKIPENPKRIRGRERKTKAYNASFRGVDAHPIPALGPRILARGQATTLSGDGLFEFDSAALTRTGRAQVKAVVRNLRGSKAVTCEGYTDYAGSRSHELRLSARRAKAVCAALAKSFTVRTATKGYGPERPAVIGGNAKGRKENRRVVILRTR